MRTKILASVLLAGILLAPLQGLAAFNSGTAGDYLLSKTNSSWSTMGLVALGASSIPDTHLKNVSGSTAVEFEAPILAITALGQNPRTFSSQDLVAKLKTYYSGGQIGDTGTLNDDYFGILALISAGEVTNDPVITGSKNFILAEQNGDGGFGFTTSSTSDTNMTAVAVASLVSAGVSVSDTKIQNAITYLTNAQNADGGWGYEPNQSSDSSSTAWVMWAYKSVGSSVPNKGANSPTSYLESNQDATGFFKYQNGSSEDAFSAPTTAYAVIALSGKTLPLKIVQNSPGTEKYPLRIEGKDGNVCEGSFAGPTALDIVKNAASTCGFTYNIQNLAFGPYLNKVNNDEAVGLIGWLYAINNTAPDVGANDYSLKSGDSVFWYYGDFTWKISRLTLSDSEINSGTGAVALVESFSNNTWLPVANAKVFYGASEASTDTNGKASFSPADGVYKVYAEGSAIVRSNSQMLKVGNGVSGNINMSVNITGGGNPGPGNDTVAFSVNPGSLDFGTLAAGASAEKSLEIKNTGNKNIILETQMTGDTAFTENLKLDESTWQSYNAQLIAGAAKNTNAKLTVPGGSTTGNKSGILTFWATVN